MQGLEKILDQNLSNCRLGGQLPQDWSKGNSITVIMIKDRHRMAVRCRVEISWAIKRTNRSNVQTDVNYESFMPPHAASVSSAGVLVEPGDPRIWGSGLEESRRRLM